MARGGILRGAGTLVSSRVAGLAFTFVQIKLSVTYLSPHGYGLLSTAVLLVGTFEALTELGLGSIVVRRVSGGADLQRTAGLAKAVAITIMGPLVAVAIACGSVLYSDPQVVQGVAILATGLAATMWSATFVPIAQVTDAFGGISAADIGGRIASLAIVVVAVAGDLGLAAFFVAQLAAPLTRALISHLWGRRQGHFPPVFEWRAMRDLLCEALPLTYIAVISGLYFQLDGLLMTKLTTPSEVGAYNLAYRIVVNLNIIGTAAAAVLIARYSRAAAIGDERYRHVLRLSAPPLLALCLPVATLLWPFSDEIVALVGSEEFVPISAGPLSLLWVSAALALLTTVISSALVAGHAQNFLATLNTINLLLNLVLNLVLIPRLGATGAALALICTELSGLSVCLVMLTRRLGWFIPVRAMLILCGCAAAALVTGHLLAGVWWIVRGLIMAVTFFGLALLTRAVTPAGMRELSGAA